MAFNNDQLLAINTMEEIERLTATESQPQPSPLLPGAGGEPAPATTPVSGAVNEASPPPSTPPLQQPPVDLQQHPQLAWNGGQFIDDLIDTTKMLTRHNTDDVLKAARTVPVDERAVTPEQLRNIGATVEARVANRSKVLPPDGRTSDGTNLMRHHPGAPAADLSLLDRTPDELLLLQRNSDDMGVLLEVTGKELGLRPTTSPQADIKAGVQSMEDVARELAPVFQGKQNGLLTKNQLFAARSLLVTLSDDLHEQAARIAAGDNRAETLLEYQRTIENFSGLRAYVRGETAEVARALAQQRMIADVIKRGSLPDLDAALAAGGSEQGIIKHAEALTARWKSGVDPLANASQASQSMYRTAVGASVMFWKNNILSGVKTHARNIGGNSINSMWENFIVRPTAAVIGETRHAVTGTNDYVSKQETLANLVGAYGNLTDAIRMAARTLVTNESAINPGSKAPTAGNPLLDVNTLLFGQKAGQAITNVETGSFRALGAEDEFFKVFAYNGELRGLAVRDGIKKGLTGDKLWAHVSDMLDNPTPELHGAALEAAERLTFTHKGDGAFRLFGDAMQKIASTRPEFGFILAFVKTPNALLQAAVENSALSAASPRIQTMLRAGGAQRDIALAKITMGFALTMAVYEAHQAGLITGSGADSPAIRSAMEHEGMKTNAIRVGDSYYTITGLQPISQVMLSTATALDRAKYAKTEMEFQQIIWQTVFTLADHTLDASYMQGFANLLDAIQYGGDKADKLVANIGSGFVPYSSALKDVRDLTDPQPRALTQDNWTQHGVVNTLTQQVKNNLPGQSKDLRPKRYWDGAVVIPDQGRVAYAISPVKIGDLKEPDEATRELIKNNVAPNEPRPEMVADGVTVSLASLDNGSGVIYDRYIELVGQHRRAVVEVVMASAEYDQAEGGVGSERAALLQRALLRGLDEAREVFVREELMALVEATPPEQRDAVAQKLVLDGSYRAFVLDALINYDDAIASDPALKKGVRVKGQGATEELPEPGRPKGAGAPPVFERSF